ncbi:MAG: flagellin [Actinomycetota bacterium]|jgi:flagellin|nr:flagellin [Actinomycetota bacterium]
MSLSINTNIAAIDAYNNLNNTSNQLDKTISQLSSGLQIQTAADNSSGYVIAQDLQAQSNGLNVGISNGQNAISVLQIANGAMNQQVSILQRMNQLATQASNSGALSSNALNAVNTEFTALSSQLNQIAQSTTFGSSSNSLLATNAVLTFQLGAYATTTNQVTVQLAFTTASSLGVSGLSLTTFAGAQSALSSVQTAIDNVASIQASLGASQNQIQADIANLTISQQNVQAAHSSLVDANMAQTVTTFTAQQILMQAGTSMLGQAQQLPSMLLKLIP